MIYLYTFLSLVAFSLAFYLGTLVVKLNHNKKQINDLNDNHLSKRKDSIYESLAIIAKVMIQGQCDLTEGCIRAQNLIAIQPELRDDPKLQIFKSMFSRVKHFATFADYNNLPLKDRVCQDTDRKNIEEEYSDEIIKACHHLIRKLNDPNSSIHN